MTFRTRPTSRLSASVQFSSVRSEELVVEPSPPPPPRTPPPTRPPPPPPKSKKTSLFRHFSTSEELEVDHVAVLAELCLRGTASLLAEQSEAEGRASGSRVSRAQDRFGLIGHRMASGDRFGLQVSGLGF